MQQLSTNVLGNYTDAQLAERLTADGAAVGTRLEVLDSGNNVVTGIPISATAVSVQIDTTRQVVGSLTMTMLPSALINFPFLYRVRPWYRLGMLDGGVAEWPMGIYLWNVPTRNGLGLGDETWTVTLGDLTHLLQLTGPGPNGYTAKKGATVTTIMADIVASLGLDPSGIAHNPATLAGDMHWGLTSSSSTTVTTWLDILTALHQRLAYYPPWFDVKGLYRALSQPDLQGAGVAKSYTDGRDGTMMSPSTSEEDVSKLANRVIVTGKSAKGLALIATADLNTLSPGHKFSQAQIGFYVDAAIQDNVSATLDGLQLTADAELNRRMTHYQKLTLDTLLWPTHEAFDIIGVQFSTDAELSAGISTLETGWTADLRTSKMTHTLQRITP